MFWHKSWTETRSRFLIGLVLLTCSAMAAVFTYPQVAKLMPLAENLNVNSEIGRRIREAIEVQRTFSGYIWSQWFHQQLLQWWTLFAILLGSGGLFSQTFGGATMFTLSLPVTRGHVVGVRTAVGLAELLVLALVPSLVIPLSSSAVGESYSLVNVLVHSACLFIAGAFFFSLALFLSTVFADLWRPMLIGIGIAFALSLAGWFREFSDYSIYTVMSAESYFRAGVVPWFGLLASAALSAGMIYGAAVNVSSQDF
jgi:hypothetical protein